MVGIDTNVPVRYMVQDDEEQAALARELIEDQLGPANPAHIPLALRQLLVTDCFVIKRHALAWAAVRDYGTGNADYADCLIARINHEMGATPTFAFGRKAARGDGFHLLTARDK